MRSTARYMFVVFLTMISYAVSGQKTENGTFIMVETDSFGSRIEETIKIYQESIWFERKKFGNSVLPGEKFTNWSGDVMYSRKRKGNVDGPSYFGWLMVMSCDTCPAFWKHTLKSKDSLKAETHEWVTGDTDTLINNGDTTYMTPTFVSVDDPTDLDRVRALTFTFTSAGDILMDGKLYRRKKKKR
ncbi:hypothetical protein [Paraflavitalea sp. CAU 1676]|uniref:hypothetical protein n=1 Tax=Paraflavitalea sp. CAU 1676 TaxID=3032598 RepID=UPI0023DC162F|nr:hypothetical protein [Paraflavitalea sp. CAU 1676]MDF2187716.1 hypothetical protein [Paraflavitalea sp. CAU 1676]